MSSTQQSGYVYAITNKWFNTRQDHRLGGGIPLVKIGYTKNKPTLRAIEGDREFRKKTFLPGPFNVEMAIYVENYKNVETQLHEFFKEFSEYEEGFGTEFFTVPIKKVEIAFQLLLNGSQTNKLWSEKSDQVEEVSEEVVEVPEGETKESELRKITKKIKKIKKRKKRIKNPFSKEEQGIFTEKAKISSKRRDIWQKFSKTVTQKGKIVEQFTYKPPKDEGYKGKQMGLASAMIWEREYM